MTANDSGHINNLDEDEKENLKDFWIELIDRIINESDLTLETLIDSNFGKELFLTFGYDNPDTVLLRWLRARKWDIDNALDQFMNTLKWRIEWGVNQLVANGESDLSYEEISTGKTYYTGYDREGRPINYCSAKDHIKGQFTAEETEKFTVLLLETGRKLITYPVETVTIIFDLSGFSMRNMDYQHVKFLINLLQNHYPESLGLVLIVNSNRIFNGCWYIIRRWLDPVVEKKVHFIKNINDLDQYIDFSNLPQRINGNQPDFNFIPPNEQDKLMLKTFREDINGKTKAFQNHRQASINYLNITLQWAKLKDKNSIIAQRKEAMKQLTDAYQQLIPYIHTKTHYHRIGLINEPIFDITFKKIQESKIEESNQQETVYF